MHSLQRIFQTLLVAATLVSAGGCRQADGAMPTPAGQTSEELVDISRDLLNARAGDAQAPTDLADDIAKYAEGRGNAEARELARRIASVLPGSKLDEPSAQRLAHHLWLAVASKELSSRQVETLQNDVQALLTSAGVPEERAEGAAAHIEEVQKAVTVREKRWYEVF